MEARQLELRSGRALDPSYVVCSEVLEPRAAVLGDDEREEIGDGIVIIGVG